MSKYNIRNNSDLREKILQTIRGEGHIFSDEVGFGGHYRIGIDVQSAIDFARKFGDLNLLVLGDQLEKFIEGQKVEPIKVDNMKDVYNEIHEKVWGLHKMKKHPDGTYEQNMTTGTVLGIEMYFRLVANYIAFKTN